jgi:hypothetical protein
MKNTQLILISYVSSCMDVPCIRCVMFLNVIGLACACTFVIFTSGHFWFSMYLINQLIWKLIR